MFGAAVTIGWYIPAMRLRELPPTDIRTLPNYTVLESSHYLRIPSSTLKSWIVGRDYDVRGGRKRSRSLIGPAQTKPMLLSFVNLVEAHVLHAIRHKHGVRLGSVRRALDYVEGKLGERHPLITREFKTDGVDLFIEQLGELVNASQDGQVALRQFFDLHLRRVEHDEQGIANRLFPFTRLSHVDQPRFIVINPGVSFGRPVIEASGVSTAAILERHQAGESLEHLARDFRLSLPEIEEAIRCESGRS